VCQRCGAAAWKESQAEATLGRERGHAVTRRACAATARRPGSSPAVAARARYAARTTAPAPSFNPTSSCSAKLRQSSTIRTIRRSLAGEGGDVASAAWASRPLLGFGPALHSDRISELLTFLTERLAACPLKLVIRLDSLAVGTLALIVVHVPRLFVARVIRVYFGHELPSL